MKKLIIALVLVIGLSGFAQESTKEEMEKMTPEQRHQKHMEHLTKELNLDAKQQKEVSQIMSEKSMKIQAINSEYDSKKGKMSDQDKMECKSKKEAEHKVVDTKMKAVLTADQYQKWIMMKEEKKKEMMDKKNKM